MHGLFRGAAQRHIRLFNTIAIFNFMLAISKNHRCVIFQGKNY